MQQELAITDHAAEFTCPRCGASAFEVTGMKHQVDLDIDAAGDRTSFISMKCLRCLHVFHHNIHEYVRPEVYTEAQEDSLSVPLLHRLGVGGGLPSAR